MFAECNDDSIHSPAEPDVRITASKEGYASVYLIFSDSSVIHTERVGTNCAGQAGIGNLLPTVCRLKVSNHPVCLQHSYFYISQES